tara:strand:- start:10238 stop:10876 length:639 start_codon:yes stop_codon:yes gene_type:complete
MSRVALVVVANSITEGRIRDIMSRRGWEAEICHDGDKAVDEYVRLNPDLVFLSLDLPTMNGHIAALEMRETNSKARIAFVSSKARLTKTRDAAYSSGAVTTLVTPITFDSVERQWEVIMGDIPEAPGLSDLDALYPEIIDPEPELPVLPPLPSLPPPVILQPVIEKPKPKKRRKLKLLILSLLMIGGSVGIAHYLEFINLQIYFDELLQIID